MKKQLKVRIILIVLAICSSLTLSAGEIVNRIDPANWWVGMKNPEVQLMVNGDLLSTYEVSLSKYRGVKLKSVERVENQNYLFLNLIISPKTQPGKLEFVFTKGSVSHKVNYEIKAREVFSIRKIDQSDLIYLILPDRFSNGDSTNDNFLDMADTSSDRSNPWLRHGGDLQGIINHLEYLKDLGVSALWLNPVIENDQPLTHEGGTWRSAYHGYGFTDHYRVDRRLGGNTKYLELVEKSHDLGLKVIQDAVYNHVGINHYTIKDLPMKSWLNQWPEYTNTSYKEQAALDVHASEYDRLRMTDGWFMPFLPDLNQRNPFVQKYLIQHALWTVETFRIDGFRIDTYMYNDMEFMNSCNAALKDEYPDLFLYGESLANPVPNQAAFVRNNMNLAFVCNLESTVDNQLHKAILQALNEPYGWNEGVNRVNQVLVQDYLYQNPEKLVTYLDNHDEHRFFSVVGEDYAKFRMGLTWLMTMRGIPQIYYGTEILTKNFKNPTDAEVRKDFPGGWPEDKVNKFLVSGRSDPENEAFKLVQKLAKIRSTSEAVAYGKFTQFLPFDDGVYVYFRHTEKQLVMVVTNSSKTPVYLSLPRFEELLKGRKKAVDLMSDKEISDLSKLEIPGNSVKILEIHD